MCFNTSVWPDLKALEGLTNDITAFLGVIFFKPSQCWIQYVEWWCQHVDILPSIILYN